MAIVTISRELGSGGEEIGRALAGAMGYKYVDMATCLSDISQRDERWRDWAPQFDTRSPGIWERCDWTFMGFGALLQETLLEHAEQDNVVMVGMGANFLLEGIPHALRMRISAPVGVRIRRVMETRSLDEDAAWRLIDRTDHARASFIRSYYGKEWNDSDGYDIHVNIGEERSIADVVAATKAILMQREAHTTREARRLVEMRAAAARVKAGLTAVPGLYVPTIELKCDGMRIVLQGVVHNPREYRLVESRARALARGFPLRCELKYRCESLSVRTAAGRSWRISGGSAVLRWIQKKLLLLLPMPGGVSAIK